MVRAACVPAPEKGPRGSALLLGVGDRAPGPQPFHGEGSGGWSRWAVPLAADLPGPRGHPPSVSSLSVAPNPQRAASVWLAASGLLCWAGLRGCGLLPGWGPGGEVLAALAPPP